MEKSCSSLWGDCLSRISLALVGQKDGEWIYKTWFAPISADGYDAVSRTLTLRVPSIYVYEYIEHYHIKLLADAIRSTFGPDAHLRYRVMQNADGCAVDFLQTPPAQVKRFSIANAEQRFRDGMRRVLGDSMQWLPCYDEVAAWLADNRSRRLADDRGRGLLCLGPSGTGKSVVCREVLPALLGSRVPVVTAIEMNDRIDELINGPRCIIIDDLGREPVSATVNFKRRTPFFELCDAAERRGILLVITTNLSTSKLATPHPMYPCSIEERYGREVLSRLHSLVTTVRFEGSDMRR